MGEHTAGLSVAEAAQRLGVSERTIRRRIQTGEIRAASVDTPQGHTWQIDPASLPAHPAPPPGTNGRHPADATRQDPAGPGSTLDATRQPSDMPPGTPPGTAGAEVLELVRLVDRLQNEKTQLAGQVGYLQRQVVEQQETIQRLLAAPKETVDVEATERGNTPPEAEQMPAASEPKRSWWQRLIGR